MTLRYNSKAACSLWFSFAWSLGLFCILGLGTSLAQENCCRFDTDKKAVWEKVLPPPVPQPEESCRWDADLLPQVAYFGFDRLMVGFHFGCYSLNNLAEHTLVKHTQDFLIALDRQTGESIRQISWRDVSIGRQGIDSIQLFSVRDKYLLVRAGTMLQLLSPNLEEICSRRLPIKDENDEWRAHVSPRGNVGLLSYFSGERAPVEDHWFNPDTLEDSAVGLSPPRLKRAYAVTDSVIYYNPQQVIGVGIDTGSRSEADAIFVSKSGDSAGFRLCACRAVPREALRNGLFVASAGPAHASFFLVDSSGKAVYRSQQYGADLDYVTDLKVASQADRFAFSFGHLEIGLLRHGAREQVLVFDAHVQKDIFRLKINGRPQNGLWLSPRVALTPDGNELAVMVGLNLKVFSIDKQQ